MPAEAIAFGRKVCPICNIVAMHGQGQRGGDMGNYLNEFRFYS